MWSVSSTSLRVAFAIGLLLLLACRKEAPSKPPAPAPSASVSVAPKTPVAAPPVSATARPTRSATPLDAAGQLAAKTYLQGLARGRKATVAKDYAQAETHFTQALAALPGDSRALGERGYARLLAEKLPGAREDLLAAQRYAPTSALLQQILHNLMLLERKAGNEAAAASYEKEKLAQKAARHLASGIDCSTGEDASDLEPNVVKSFDEALKLIVASVVETDHQPASEVAFSKAFDDDYPAQLKADAALDPFPDKGVVVYTASPSGYRNHAVIAQSGKFYVYPNLSNGSYALCGPEGLAEVTIDGGGARPWRIRRQSEEDVRSYLCTNCDNLAEGEEPQSMGYCIWIETKIEVDILDGTSLRGLRHVYLSARPQKDGASSSPSNLLAIEWQADQAIVESCGERKTVRYVGE